MTRITFNTMHIVMLVALVAAVLAWYFAEPRAKHTRKVTLVYQSNGREVDYVAERDIALFWLRQAHAAQLAIQRRWERVYPAVPSVKMGDMRDVMIGGRWHREIPFDLSITSTRHAYAKDVSDKLTERLKEFSEGFPDMYTTTFLDDDAGPTVVRGTIPTGTPYNTYQRAKMLGLFD